MSLFEKAFYTFLLTRKDQWFYNSIFNFIIELNSREDSKLSIPTELFDFGSQVAPKTVYIRDKAIMMIQELESINTTHMSEAIKSFHHFGMYGFQDYVHSYVGPVEYVAMINKTITIDTLCNIYILSHPSYEQS